MITLVSLFIGRMYAIDEYLEGLLNLDYDKKQIHLIWHTATKLKLLEQKLGDWLKEHGKEYASITFLQCSDPHYHFEEKDIRGFEMVAKAYNHCMEFYREGHFFAWEDDMVNPSDSLNKLLLHIKDDIVLAAGRVFFRPSVNFNEGNPIIWGMKEKEVFPGECIEKSNYVEILKYYKEWGVDVVGATHLGCTLIAENFIKNYTFKSQRGSLTGPDIILGEDIREMKKKSIVDWSIHCKHKDIDNKYV